MLTQYGWKYKHYFVIVEVGEKNIRARCKLCAGNKTMSCAQNTTSNLKKHLENVYKKAREVKGANRKGKRQRADDDDNDDDDDNQPLKRQCTLPSMLRDASSTKLHKALFEYIIEDMQQLSKVESPAFRRLIGSICPYQLPDRKSFTQQLDELYDMMSRR